MKNVVLSVFGICLAGVALCVSWLTRESPAAPDPGAASRLTSEVASTNLRLDEIETRLARLGDLVSASRGSTTAPIVPRPHEPEEGESLEGRVAKIEASVAQLAEVARQSQPKPAGGGAAAAPDPLVLKGIDDLTRTARNAAAAEKDRLTALRGLRGARLADGTDARIPVVEDMVRLAEASADAETRADVWRQLSHVTERSMLSPLISALQNDSADKVREEAAETLADFLPDESARRALQHAAENDRSNKVRSEAWNALGMRRR